MEKKLKHLEFIQGVINRLAANSFQLKGWSVVLVSAILVLLAREGRLDAARIALVPVLVFWILDGYFLWQERLFRALYDHVRTLCDDCVNFSMDLGRFKEGYKRTWPAAILSLTLLVFYVTLMITVCCARVAFAQINGRDGNGSTSLLQLPL